MPCTSEKGDLVRIESSGQEACEQVRVHIVNKGVNRVPKKLQQTSRDDGKSRGQQSPGNETAALAGLSLRTQIASKSAVTRARVGCWAGRFLSMCVLPCSDCCPAWLLRPGDLHRDLFLLERLPSHLSAILIELVTGGLSVSYPLAVCRHRSAVAMMFGLEDSSAYPILQ